MKFIIQFLIIIAFAFVGEVLHTIIPMPVPASIYGIALLFIALTKGWIRVKDIREVSMFLISVMPVMFIPSAVGLIDAWHMISHSVFKYLALICVTTIVTLSSAGVVTQFVIRRGRRNR